MKKENMKLTAALLAAALVVPNVSAMADEDPFGKYDEEVNLSIAISSTNLVFDSTQDGYVSLEDNVWTRVCKERLGITFDYIWTAPDEDYTTKWNMAIASDDIPDVAIVPASIYTQLVEADMVEDMTDLYEEYASDEYKAAVEADGGICKSFITKDGRMLGLPHPGATPDDFEYLYIRQDWLDELNLEWPKSLDELTELARAFVENKMGGENTVGIATRGSLPSIEGFGGIFEAFGVHRNIWVEAEDGSLIFGDVQPEMKDALEYMQGLYAEGLIPSDFATLTWDQLYALLSSGQCGIFYGPYWAPSSVYNSETMELGDWSFGEGVMADGSPFVSSASAAPNFYVFVKKGIEHPEAVVKLINLQFEMIRTDGEHFDNYKYTKEDGTEGSITTLYYLIAPFLRAPWKNMTRAMTIINALETGDESEVIGTQYEADYLDIKKCVEEDIKDTTYSFVMGIFGPDGIYDTCNTMWKEGRIYLDKFNSIYSDFALENMGNMRAILDAEYVKIIMGQDISTFDTAVETWYKTGGEKITEEVNEWYNSTK